jgi:outer membrane receptor protein involved in Fe transport
MGPPLKFKVTALGYKNFEKTVSFDFKPDRNKGPEQMLSAVDKDLGNIRIIASVNELKGVTVKADEPTVKMTIDKKIYNVEKNLTSTGGTATDAMKTIPGVNVDIDGNVSVRNASPTIFVDGRPTTLTLDQIPSDNIQSIEVITNPSVKYDASGGMAGIINIVLKKNKRMGYNGSIRAGIDKRAKWNGGLDLNVREKKINFFVSSTLHQRKSIAEGWSDRINYTTFDTNKIYQQTYNQQRNQMLNNRLGFDWFVDIRNTITVSANYTMGDMNPLDTQNISYRFMPSNTDKFYSNRATQSFRRFRNLGNSLQYKHLFPKSGEELTADLNLNLIRAQGGSDAVTTYLDLNGVPYRNSAQQNQAYTGAQTFYTGQVDYTNPLTDKSKLDIGVRLAYRDFASSNVNSLYNDSLKYYVKLNSQQNNYTYHDLVTAAYGNYARQYKKWGYQAGLRMESSNYQGKLTESGKIFSIQYPLSLFPSLAVSYKIKEAQDINLNLSRRINRPNFFQLMPYIDFSDSLNLSRGNPALRPEFTYSGEVSYLYAYKNNQSLMANVYAKIATGLITRYILQEYNDDLHKNILVTSYENARTSQAYGLELVSKNTFKKWADVTTNVNIYQSVINGTNIMSGLNISQWSWFARLNANFKFPQNWSLQVTGDYFSKMAFQQGGGGGGGGMMGGGMGMGGTQNTAQGYSLPNYGLDVALKRDFLKTKTLSLTLNFTDVLHTRRAYSFSESQYFQLYTFKQRDWQFFRLNLSYRFGKFDTSLFKRRNIRTNGEGEGMM